MHPHFRHFNRPGSMSVEMIGVLVALLVLTIGIVQFGIFLGNAQIVAFAAKVAGEEASQTPALPVVGDVPSNIVEAMQRHLESSNVKYCFEDEAIEDVARNMGDIQVRRLPVLSRDKCLVGIVSLGDLAVKHANQASAALSNISEPGGQHTQTG